MKVGDLTMAWKQLRAILLLPGMVTVVIPATILYFTGISQSWNIVVGSLFVFLGLASDGLDDPAFHHGREGDARPVEPDAEARRAWRLPTRPQSDDHRRLRASCWVKPSSSAPCGYSDGSASSSS